jgi:protein tyrosine phosphatase (PTP) superfamily phosphohydrolase (DUF442 family)
MIRTYLRALTLTVGHVALAIAAVAAPMHAQRMTGPAPAAVVPAPELLDTTGLFQERFAKVGDDFFVAGQPTARALREMKARGVTTVVNLRSPQEMARIPFDEAALVRELGMTYIYLPMRGTPDLPYAPSAVTALAQALREADGKVLLHCTIAWRASHLLAAYLIQERKQPVPAVLAATRTINLMDEHRVSNGDQPLELFLNRVVPEMAHPKP